MRSITHLSSRTLTSGFATMEYCIVCVLVAMVLFANPNIAQKLVEAVKAFYRALTFFISLP
jgi:Flp pilus assembly pilin Flp